MSRPHVLRTCSSIPQESFVMCLLEISMPGLYLLIWYPGLKILSWAWFGFQAAELFTVDSPDPLLRACWFQVLQPSVCSYKLNTTLHASQMKSPRCHDKKESAWWQRCTESQAYARYQVMFNPQISDITSSYKCGNGFGVGHAMEMFKGGGSQKPQVCHFSSQRLRHFPFLPAGILLHAWDCPTTSTITLPPRPRQVCFWQECLFSHLPRSPWLSSEMSVCCQPRLHLPGGAGG